ncbi:hypothetical protein AOL_s00140g109 [Orbilia oligospora ATCC 24927]|uniref:Uncharacterized protein n=2 Tax=Orbilia oligospora TaxID=2813651 RepID=G1XME0_ARTOA|nr:hypothetical protein AOL_s00140g109 [Orbilia oligospora ATCC 24927]EGX45793.1 hypothetical protein AOL_s00140g109 [Orbilia oligospora ATCC 24927]KAF3284170.1 hypothetical protein TWF970_011389 [Orbilia oligospora]
MVCDINTPTKTYHTFPPRLSTTASTNANGNANASTSTSTSTNGQQQQQQPHQHQRRAHRVRILMTRGVHESIAIRLSKKRGSAWQPLSSRWIECRESEWRG